ASSVNPAYGVKRRVKKSRARRITSSAESSVSTSCCSIGQPPASGPHPSIPPPGEGRARAIDGGPPRRVRDSRPQGRDTGAPASINRSAARPGAAVARRRWQQSYRCLRRAKPGPERSGGTRPNPGRFPDRRSVLQLVREDAVHLDVLEDAPLEHVLAQAALPGHPDLLHHAA